MAGPRDAGGDPVLLDLGVKLMRLVRGLIGAVLWILAALLGLVAVVLCVTVILLPLGIPLLMLSRRLFTQAVRLMLPRSMAHPVQELGKKGRKAASTVPEVTGKAAKKGRKVASAVPEVTGETAKRGRKAAKRQRKQLA